MTFIDASANHHLTGLGNETTGEEAFIIAPLDTPYFRARQLCDRLIAAALLAPTVPLIAVLILLIRITSRGPSIYAQRRVGKGGQVFTMYKLRSMTFDAEARSGPTWSSMGRDPRVTPLGFWLRKLHLDELPQLYNVLQGHMSLIGPRPERPEFVKILIERIPQYAERLQVAPGITGLAQVNLPPDSDLNSVRRKLLLDREYIASANAFLDLRILVATGMRVFGLRGERTMRWLGLRRVADLNSQELLSDSTCFSHNGRAELRPVDLCETAEDGQLTEASSRARRSGVPLPNA